MASIVKRGTRSAPKFYVQFDRGRALDGSRVRNTCLLKGVQNLVEARQELARVEWDLAAGRDPFPGPWSFAAPPVQLPHSSRNGARPSRTEALAMIARGSRGT